MNQTKKWFGTITTGFMAIGFFFPIFDSTVSVGIKIICAIFGSFLAWAIYSTHKNWDSTQKNQADSTKTPSLTWKQTFQICMGFGIIGALVSASIVFFYWAYRTPLIASDFLPKTVLGWIVAYWLFRSLFKGKSNNAVLPEQTESEMEEAAKAASVSLEEYKSWTSEYREWVKKFGHKPNSPPKESEQQDKKELA